MAHAYIDIRGAREHNLQNIDIKIPRDKLVVITGLSGSGKSSLAFDTIYAEGQRRYVESLSAYARQFLGQMEKPDVDQIDGLSPAISIDQKGVSHNPRSTVGTVTEIYDYLRLLFARVGIPHCPNCGQVIARQGADQIVDAVLNLPEGSRILLLAPLVRGRKGSHERVFQDLRKAGFVRARINGELRDLGEEEDFSLDRYRNHTIEAVVDRLVVRHGPEAIDRTRLTDSIETALKLGGGVISVLQLGQDGGAEQEQLFSEHFSCPTCGLSLPEIEPRTFSFNSPHGACGTCQGLGTLMQVDPELVVPNPDLSLREGAVAAWSRNRSEEGFGLQLLAAVAERFGHDLDTAWSEFNLEAREAILHGLGPEELEVRYRNHRGQQRSYKSRFEGVVTNIQRRHSETDSDWMRGELERFMATRPCSTCEGKRLKPEVLAVTVGGSSIIAVTRMAIHEVADWAETLAQGQSAVDPLKERELTIARDVLKEVRARARFLVDVGLDYLTLDRRAGSLSGGEAQRIRLATQIGSQLMGVLYILDEPSIGLHQRDNARLIRTLLSLRDVGNTVLVVEHDEETMRSADWIIDMGPGAGEHGGKVVAQGDIETVLATQGSLTADFLSGRRAVPVPARRRKGKGQSLVVRGARENNLKGIDVSIPLGTMTVVTGVSGSGKSTLVQEILHNRLAQLVNAARVPAGAHDALEGWEALDKVIDIDQSPIGRTPRSNPATYTNLFTPIRQLFASLPDAKLRGYDMGRFSFNVKGGRCEACSGDGILKIEMQFLPDIYVPCEICKGARYNRETLEIKFKELSISDVLRLSVTEATVFFQAHGAIRRKLETLEAVGLGYLKLGQPAPTLSGGEAQRVKLSRELSRVATGNTFYILDEPTTGLHFADVERLLTVMQTLVDAGNTVLIIEHNLDVIKCADHLIDLGPDGGDRGGTVVCEGTPEAVAARPDSHTGRYLAKVLSGRWVPEPIVAEA
ncbi:MAG: excinuclease ABC subunit UvrA [Anaerolineae bacterium]